MAAGQRHEADGGDLATLAGWLAEGRMESLIDSVYPLADVAAAHERSRSWRSRGKLILDVIAPDEDAPRADRAGDESCSV